MKRVIAAISLSFVISPVFANDTYSLQLGAFSTKNHKEADQLLIKAKQAGLECQKKKADKDGKKYLFVRCDQPNLYRLNIAVKKAKKANLSYYRILPSKKTKLFKPKKNPAHKSFTQLYHHEALEDLFFGENSQFVQIMQGSSSNNLEQLKKIKDAYLQEYQKSLSFSGLELQTAVTGVADRGNVGYDAKLVWNIFDNGYYGYKKDALQKRLQNGIDFDNIIKQTQSDYAQIALFEIDEIKKYIAFKYNHKKQTILHNLLKNEKKSLDAGLITLNRYENTEILYQKAKQALNYLRFTPKKVFDIRYKDFIQKIEDIHLTDENALAQSALKHDVSLKVQKERMNQIDTLPSWKDRIKADIFVDQKRYTSIPRDDTLAGFQVSVPIELHHPSDELSSIKLQTFKLREKSYKALLQKRVHYYYTKLYESQKIINQMKKQMHLEQKSLRHLTVKEEHPIGDMTLDIKHQKSIHKLKILELEQNIWFERCQMLKNLVTLEFQTGVKII